MTKISTSDKADQTVETIPKTALAPEAGVESTGSKVCRKCGTVLNEETWSPYYRKKNNRICRKCVAEASRDAYWEEPEARRKKYREQYADHIGAEGKAERKQVRAAKFMNLESKLGTTEQLAWAAGLWEAEGNIDIEQGKHILKDGLEHLYPRVRLKVFNNDTSLLERFKQIVGGAGSIRRDKEAEGNRADAFVYYIRDSKAVWITQKMWPYVVSGYRKNQIKKVCGEVVDTWPIGEYKTEEEKLAWIAGIFEGEGCAGWYFTRTKERRSPKIVSGKWENGQWVEKLIIANTQIDMLETIRDEVGFGSISPNRGVFNYSVGSAQARAFATSILPYVYSNYKRQQLIKMFDAPPVNDALELSSWRQWLNQAMPICSSCAVPLTDDNWSKRASRIHYWCKACEQKYKKQLFDKKNDQYSQHEITNGLKNSTIGSGTLNQKINPEDVKLELITTKNQRQIMYGLITTYHSYVKSVQSVGRSINYLIYFKNQVVGCIGGGSPPMPVSKCIQDYFERVTGSYEEARNMKWHILPYLANNWKFTLIPNQQHNLGSKVISIFIKTIIVDWKEKYGVDLKWIFTYVGGGKAGTVYKAAGWEYLGMTRGRHIVGLAYDLQNKDKKETITYPKKVFIKSLI